MAKLNFQRVCELSAMKLSTADLSVSKQSHFAIGEEEIYRKLCDTVKVMLIYITTHLA